jgi:chromobox protein 1
MGAGGEFTVRLPFGSHGDERKLTTKPRETSVLDEYYAAHGGKEKMLAEVQSALKNKKRGRTDTDTPTSNNKRSRKNGAHPAETTPPATAKQAAWKPPAGSWEDEVADIDASVDDETGKLMVYLTWKDGHKTQHESGVVYKRCPQKVCPSLLSFDVDGVLTSYSDASFLRAACTDCEQEAR